MERSGIYCIVNMKNGKRYVGQSVHLGERMKQHFHKLKKGIHSNKPMQHDYKTDWKYFKWEILEICAVPELGAREKYWSEYYHCFDPKRGYNHQRVRVDQLYADPDDYIGSNK